MKPHAIRFGGAVTFHAKMAFIPPSSFPMIVQRLNHCRNCLLAFAVIVAAVCGCSESGPTVIDGTQEEIDDLMEKMRAEEETSLEDRKERE
ncbi:MAG: hypothetical protein MI861_17035 [Pirellulales bacterium]|nr:hypothetical protein [Pirellulales bacterium]